MTKARSGEESGVKPVERRLEVGGLGADVDAVVGSEGVEVVCECDLCGV